MYNLNFEGKVCGVCGSADSAYDKYGNAVHMNYEQLEKPGTTMIPDRIIADLELTNEELER
ncbi:hypothetical protein [Oceanobacillus polygoni]|uniref:Flavodoxin n=1 Tax=Oceanobacillus polygoni TaxID=1235259 RepID=A0A9X1CHU7_9BACI|nr:hypothetical protein [Oceanobacillus polygoni]MBP2077982.1 flavodoxin [Oceanobacillus polygoni]